MLGQQNPIHLFLQPGNLAEFRCVDQQRMAVLAEDSAPDTSLPGVNMFRNLFHLLPPVLSRRDTGDPFEYLCKITLTRNYAD